jgi:hypothetical protein
MQLQHHLEAPSKGGPFSGYQHSTASSYMTELKVEMALMWPLGKNLVTRSIVEPFHQPDMLPTETSWSSVICSANTDACSTDLKEPSFD